MAKRRICYLFGLLGSFVFYMAYQQWFSWILLNFVLLLPWLSLVVSLGAIFHMKMEPSAAQRIPLGSLQQIHLKGHCKHPIPPHRARFRVTQTMTGESCILKPGDRLPTDHCTALQVRLYRARVCDYLGLFCFSPRKTLEHTFLVMPEPVKMEIMPDLSRYLAQRLIPKAGGGYAENHEIRQYRPGDNLNQIHWKLSAKAGELMLREPMEPERGLMLLTMDLCGTASELDVKLGQLRWLSGWLLERGIPFEVRVLTGKGIECWTVRDEWSRNDCIVSLLCSPCASDGSIRDRVCKAAWQYHIGGASVES